MTLLSACRLPNVIVYGRLLPATLGEDSMMVGVIKEINNSFGVSEIHIVADRIEAFGPDVALHPIARGKG